MIVFLAITLNMWFSWQWVTNNTSRASEGDEISYTPSFQFLTQKSPQPRQMMSEEANSVLCKSIELVNEMKLRVARKALEIWSVATNGQVKDRLTKRNDAQQLIQTVLLAD